MIIAQTRRNEEIKERWETRGSIPIYRVFQLADMARHNVIPDGSFSDDECNIWEEFHLMNNSSVN